jgi:MATE family multidrug resistance protein
MPTEQHTDGIRLETTYRQILSIALPISFSLLVPQFNFLTNSYLLSRLGEGFLGAAGITGVYYLIFAVTGYGLNNGLQALISRRAGQGRIQEIGKLFAQSLFLSFIIAAAGILFTWLIAPALFRKAVEPGLAELAISFLKIRIWGLPFLFLYQMRNGLLVGTNQSRYLIWGTLAETLSNIFLDYALIFGHFGFPAMGFNGAAYASIAAEAIGMFTVFGIIWKKDMHKRFNLFKDLRFDKEQAKLLLDQSAPLILQYGISIFTWELFFIMISHHGRLALDISQFMRVIFSFCGIFAWAYASTANTMVSNVIGQGKPQLVIPLIHRIQYLSMGTLFALVLVIQLIPGTLLSLVRSDADFITQGIPALRVVGLALLLMSFSTVWLNSVTGTGNTRATLAIELITIVLYLIYIYLVLEKWNLSITWGWGSEIIYWTSTFVFSWLYLRHFDWQKKKI